MILQKKSVFGGENTVKEKTEVWRGLDQSDG